MSAEPRLSAGPLAAAGAVLSLLGLARRLRTLVLAGALAIGLGLRLEPPRGSADY